MFSCAYLPLQIIQNKFQTESKIQGPGKWLWMERVNIWFLKAQEGTDKKKKKKKSSNASQQCPVLSISPKVHTAGQ